MRWKGFLILLIAWIVAMPVYIWTSNLPNSLDYFLPAATLLFLLMCITVAYPLLSIWKYYQKKKK